MKATAPTELEGRMRRKGSEWKNHHHWFDARTNFCDASGFSSHRKTRRGEGHKFVNTNNPLTYNASFIIILFFQVARPQRHDPAGAKPQDPDLGPGRLPTCVAPDGRRATPRPALLDGAGGKTHGQDCRHHRQGGRRGN